MCITEHWQWLFDIFGKREGGMRKSRKQKAEMSSFVTFHPRQCCYGGRVAVKKLRFVGSEAGEIAISAQIARKLWRNPMFPSGLIAARVMPSQGATSRKNVLVAPIGTVAVAWLAETTGVCGATVQTVGAARLVVSSRT
jgi:hypothetical protein